MSQSPEKAATELKNALKFGRCPICDGIKYVGYKYVGYPESCTCCGNCGNLQSCCVCCEYCLNDLSTCECSDRIVNIWDSYHFCGCCPNDISHQKGEQCPSCCAYCKEFKPNCKEFKPNCKCCKICCTTPCICCVVCKNLRIKCKCWSARILSHFMKRSVHYHKMEQQLRQLHVCPCPNTAALLVVKKEY